MVKGVRRLLTDSPPRQPQWEKRGWLVTRDGPIGSAPFPFPPPPPLARSQSNKLKLAALKRRENRREKKIPSDGGCCGGRRRGEIIEMHFVMRPFALTIVQPSLFSFFSFGLRN